MSFEPRYVSTAGAWENRAPAIAVPGRRPAAVNPPPVGTDDAPDVSPANKMSPMRHQPQDPPAGLIPYGIAVTWVALVGIGTAGFLILPAARPAPPPARPDPVVLAVNVSLDPGGAVPEQSAAKPETVIPVQPDDPPPPPESAVPDAPELVPLLPAPVIRPHPAAPAPPAPVRADPVAPRKSTAFAGSSGPPAPTGPVYQSIRYGSGAGDQPEPEYPTEADRAGQEGTVVVRFDVDTGGNVSNVTAVTPCRWPILNAAAVRSIRDTWTYPPGPPRYYQVSIIYRSKQDQ